MTDTFMQQTGIKIISGGQTGVDLAGLRAAQCMGLRTGGCAPHRWRTQAGPQPGLTLFGLQEASTSNYRDRTEVNVCNSDATLLIYVDGESPGTKLTRKLCKQHDRPCYEVDLKSPVNVPAVEAWIRARAINASAISGGFILNIAGNASADRPGIFQASFALLLNIFKNLASGPSPKDDADRAVLFAQLSNPQLAAQLVDRYDYIEELDFRNRKLKEPIDGTPFVTDITG